MATYLQGVQDYIPQFQPFQPDLNLYANVLQTKQTQYDTAWKSLNNIYGQYFYSDLTRDNNIQRKDEILKNIDFNLKRISGLDLSLEQNINQATQVFKPFYQDQYLMKDMAWTKNYMNQKGRAEGFKNSDDEDNRAQYWDTGVRSLDYMREEFRNASDQESLSFANAEYTPYVNVSKKARQIAKDAGLSMDSIEFSKDGRWIVKSTNGQQLIEPLSKLFESELGSDPAVQAVYQTQAYVNRKDYAYSNAAQFGGDKNAAEMKYLENNFNILKAQSEQRYNALQDLSTGYQNKINDIKKQIANGTATPSAKMSLAQYEQAKSINDKVLERISKENEMLNGDQTNSTASTEGFINPYGDLKSLRYKVDNGMASMLMQKDLDEAAEVLAYRGAKMNIEANPYAVKEVEHSYRMQEANLRGQYMLKAAEMRNKSDKEVNMDKHLVERGTHKYDTERFLPDGSLNPNYGRAIPIQAFETISTEQDQEGTAVGKMNSKEMDARINKLQAEQVALPQFNNTIALMRSLIDKGQMSVKEANNILGMDYNTFSKQVNKNPTWFLTRQLGDKKLMGINTKLKSWITANKDLSGLNSKEYDALAKSSLVFDDYAGYVKESQDWKRSTAIQVEKELARKGFKYSYLLYDNNGNIRSENEFYKAVKAKHGVDISGNQNELKKATMDYYTSNVRTPGIITKDMIDAFKPEEYSEMKKAAAGIYTSGQIKADIVGLDRIGGLSGTGKFTPNSSVAMINPKGYDTRTMAAFGEVLRDLDGLDWGNTLQTRATFSGTSKTDWDNIEKANLGKSRNDLTRTILSMMRKEINNPNTKMGNFKVKVNPIAAGDAKKAAIVIIPDADWLKQYVYTVKDGKPTGSGIISQNMYNNIMQHGLSIITDASQMTNSMYKNAFQTPFKANLDNTGSYTYTDDLDPNRTFTLTPSTLGLPGSYTVNGQFPVYDPNTGNTIYSTINEETYDPESTRNDFIDYFNQYQKALRTPQ